MFLTYPVEIVVHPQFIVVAVNVILNNVRIRITVHFFLGIITASKRKLLTRNIKLSYCIAMQDNRCHDVSRVEENVLKNLSAFISLESKSAVTMHFALKLI